ncbi:hypothetical protein [uncultured Megasphaera sp.]|uniref:hypothetical protein n=1 Tax=uncultured Megasphaera sp. TaxID=165188 RepID=UPI00266EAEC2|nr:hypothetical protein [uncultured Megasphaera sp.]
MVNLKRGIVAGFTFLCLTLGAGSVFAEDVWAYTYHDGTQAYVDTDLMYRLIGGKIHVKVKKVKWDRVISIEEFLFNHDEGSWWYGYRFDNGPYKGGGNVTNSESVWNIFNVVQQYL